MKVAYIYAITVMHISLECCCITFTNSLWWSDCIMKKQMMLLLLNIGGYLGRDYSDIAVDIVLLFRGNE